MVVIEEEILEHVFHLPVIETIFSHKPSGNS
jgi:hypothetical protein